MSVRLRDWYGLCVLLLSCGGRAQGRGRAMFESEAGIDGSASIQ